jgi:hypothetical protein
MVTSGLFVSLLLGRDVGLWIDISGKNDLNISISVIRYVVLERPNCGGEGVWQWCMTVWLVWGVTVSQCYSSYSFRHYYSPYSWLRTLDKSDKWESSATSVTSSDWSCVGASEWVSGSMSGVEAYSGEVASGDDFFTRWLKRLHHSLQVPLTHSLTHSHTPVITQHLLFYLLTQSLSLHTIHTHNHYSLAHSLT